jgi:predicted HNH restriction endonuclease
VTEVRITQFSPLRGRFKGQDTVGDLDICQFCGILFNQAYGGYFIDHVDVGRDAEGATAEIFRKDVEDEHDPRRRVFLGFKESDIGPVCDSCSFRLQAKRTATYPKNKSDYDE